MCSEDREDNSELQSINVRTRSHLRVLSLFDGIGSGILALKKLGLHPKTYVASEIDRNAETIVKLHHPEVIHVGDIEKLSGRQVENLGPFDLVIGGSPCNELSGVNVNRRGLYDLEGSGRLFFEFKRCLDIVQLHRQTLKLSPVFWLFENVCSMKNEERDFISKFLRCQPSTFDAIQYSPAKRQRLFWGNIPGMENTKPSPGSQHCLKLQDCLAPVPGRVATVDKINTITSQPSSLRVRNTDGNMEHPVRQNGTVERLWPTEVELIMGFPKHYTDVGRLGFKDRLYLLGKAWSIPVVEQIFSGLKESFVINEDYALHMYL